MRISDWSSDVCSSDLHANIYGRGTPPTTMSRAGKTRTRQSVDARVEARDTVLSGCTGLSPALRKEDTMIRAAHYARYSSDQQDRKSVVSGKSVSVRVDLGVRRNIKKKKKNTNE